MTRGKMELSDSERERRRERMLELRQRLAKIKEEELETKPNVKKIIEHTGKSSGEPPHTRSLRTRPQKEEVKSETESEEPPHTRSLRTRPQSESESESDDDVKEEVSKLPMFNKKQRVASVPKQKTPVVKKVSIKYYGKVSKEEVDNDARLVEQLHRQDNELIEKKKANKVGNRPTRGVCGQDRTISEDQKNPLDPPLPPPLVDLEEEKINRTMKQLFGL